MPLTALHAHRWTGSVLRNVSYDLETRTLVIEVHPASLDSGVCRRVVITNCDCSFAGQLISGDTESRRLIDEPLVLADLALVDAKAGAESSGTDSVVFATSTGSVVATCGIASIDEFALNEDELPLDQQDMSVLDDWLKAA